MADVAYWASKPIAELCPDLDQRIDRSYEWLRSSGQFPRWQRMLRAYYAGAVDGGRTGTAGEQDEYTTIKVNHVHSVGESMVVMVTGSRPHFEPHASNSDSVSAKQTVIAAGLLENAMRQKDLEGVWINCVRGAVQLGECWGGPTWDATAGAGVAVDPETGAVQRTGDIEYDYYLPSDVWKDPTKEQADQYTWIGFRDWVNRYDLIAKYPEMAERIAQLPGKDYDTQGKRPRLVQFNGTAQRYDSDDVAIYYWFHKKTDALPNGRMVHLLSGDLWTFDGPLPYDEPPIYRISGEDRTGTQEGYTTLMDCLPLQSAVNSLNTVTLSNISNYGAGNVWTRTGDTPNIESLDGGFKSVTSQTKPEVLNLTFVPPIVAEFESHLVNGIEILSGVNPVRRGSSEALSQKLSGAAYALLDAKSIEYLQGLVRSGVRWLEQAATATVSIYRRFGTAPQVIELAGRSNKAFMEDFVGQRDLSSIERVTVDIGNPMSRTVAGRLNLVDYLLKLPSSPIKTPEQIEEVLATGRMEPVIEGERLELLNIKAENEKLGDGEPCFASAYDNHPMHMREHASVAASPAARENPALLNALAQHMAEHANLWRTTDPAILVALGIQPPPPPMTMLPPMGAGGPPPPGPEAQRNNGHTSAMVPPDGAGAMPQPSMPQIAHPPGQAAPMPGVM